MRLRVPERLARAHPLSQALVLGLRWAGRTPFGRTLGPAWYERRARRIADELVRLSGVEAVYLSGSALENPTLGYSDIDLMLVVELPSLAAELRLRSELVSVLRRHNRPVELFPHIDYVEARDLDLVCRFVDAYSLRLEREWRLLAGYDRRRRTPRPSQRHAELVLLAAALKHWIGQSNLLVEPHSTRGADWHERTASRLLRGALGLWLGRTRAAPLDELLAAARERGPASETIERLSRARTAPTPRLLLAAALEVLDAHAGRIVVPSTQPWPAVVRAPAPLAGLEFAELARAARGSGFDGVDVVQRYPHSDQCLAFVTAPPEGAVDRLAALCRELPALPASRFGRATLPVLLTPRLRNAAALFEPFPLLGAGWAARPAWTDGSCERPAAPARADLKLLTRVALTTLFWRPRGRALRVWREGDYGLGAMAREVLDFAPELIALDAGRPLDFSPRASPPLGEAALLERLRGLLDELRPRLHAELGSG